MTSRPPEPPVRGSRKIRCRGVMTRIEPSSHRHSVHSPPTRCAISLLVPAQNTTEKRKTRLRRKKSRILTRFMIPCTQCLKRRFGLWSTCGQGRSNSPVISSFGYGREMLVASAAYERGHDVRGENHAPYDVSSSSVPHILANTLMSSGSARMSQAYCS